MFKLEDGLAPRDLKTFYEHPVVYLVNLQNEHIKFIALQKVCFWNFHKVVQKFKNTQQTNGFDGWKIWWSWGEKPDDRLI